MRPESAQDHRSAAREILDTVCYLTLATADGDGRPWATPVWFASADHRVFFWVSSPLARHSQNIADGADVGIVVFDSTQRPGTGTGVYLAARAELVPDPEIGNGLAVYSARSEEQGMRVWDRTDVVAPARHRLYRATATEWFVNDATDTRVPIDLTDP